MICSDKEIVAYYVNGFRVLTPSEWDKFLADRTAISVEPMTLNMLIEFTNLQLQAVRYEADLCEQAIQDMKKWEKKYIDSNYENIGGYHVIP